MLCGCPCPGLAPRSCRAAHGHGRRGRKQNGGKLARKAKWGTRLQENGGSAGLLGSPSYLFGAARTRSSAPFSNSGVLGSPPWLLKHCIGRQQGRRQKPKRLRLHHAGTAIQTRGGSSTCAASPRAAVQGRPLCAQCAGRRGQGGQPRLLAQSQVQILAQQQDQQQECGGDRELLIAGGTRHAHHGPIGELKAKRPRLTKCWSCDWLENPQESSA